MFLRCGASKRRDKKKTMFDNIWARLQNPELTKKSTTETDHSVDSFIFSNVVTFIIDALYYSFYVLILGHGPNDQTIAVGQWQHTKVHSLVCARRPFIQISSSV